MNGMRIRQTALAAALAAATLGTARAEITANVALTTDYVFRGVSQTNEAAAIQGGFDFTHASGFYAGLWGSNVSGTLYNGGTLELDTYLGYATELGGIGVDVGVLRYNYRNASPSTNYEELYLGLSYGPVSLTYYRGVNLGNPRLGDYLDLSAEHELSGLFTVSAHVGWWNAVSGGQDYTDYKVAVSKDVLGVGLELAYTDTDMNATECTAFAGSTDWCDGRVVLTVSKEI